MTRLVLVMVAVATFGCSKPTEEDCRKALANMQRLMGTENLNDAGRVESEVRRCKGGSKKKAVACAINAQTLDDLRHCEFFKIPANVPGMGAGTTGSAAPSLPAGSGSATGSASAAGSGAAGSAASGSAGSGASDAAGSSATGSAAGSGSAPPTGPAQ